MLRAVEGIAEAVKGVEQALRRETGAGKYAGE